MTSLFGGTTTKRHEGADPYIKNVADYGANADIGYAAHRGKKMMKALDRGQYDSDPITSAAFAPIRDSYAASMDEADRDAGMGMGALQSGPQTALSRRISEIYRTKARDSMGQQEAAMLPALYNQASGAYQTGLNQQEGVQQHALDSALNGYLGSFYQENHGGIVPALAGAGGAAAGLGFKPFGH